MSITPAANAFMIEGDHFSLVATSNLSEEERGKKRRRKKKGKEMRNKTKEYR